MCPEATERELKGYVNQVDRLAFRYLRVQQLSTSLLSARVIGLPDRAWCVGVCPFNRDIRTNIEPAYTTEIQGTGQLAKLTDIGDTMRAARPNDPNYLQLQSQC